MAPGVASSRKSSRAHSLDYSPRPLRLSTALTASRLHEYSTTPRARDATDAEGARGAPGPGSSPPAAPLQYEPHPFVSRELPSGRGMRSDRPREKGRERSARGGGGGGRESPSGKAGRFSAALSACKHSAA